MPIQLEHRGWWLMYCLIWERDGKGVFCGRLIFDICRTDHPKILTGWCAAAISLLHRHDRYQRKEVEGEIGVN